MRGLMGIVVAVLGGLGALAPAAGASAPAQPALAYVTGGDSGVSYVWVADSSGGYARKLGKGDSPLLSPNGLMVAAVDVGSSDHALTLYPTTAETTTVYPTTAETTTVYPTTAETTTAETTTAETPTAETATGGTATGYFGATTAADAVAWSPDSRYLAVELMGDNAPSLSGYGLAIIDTETGTEQMIAKGVIYGAGFEPGTSDTLVYARASSLSATAATNIFTVAADGTGTTQITTDGRDAAPVWGTRGIAFVHERLRKGYAPLGQIWLMQPNGSDRKQITHISVGLLAEGLVPLAFSADGTRLAAEYEGEDTAIGYSVSVLTGHATQLKVGNQAVSAWGVSADGRSVLISVGGFEQPASRAKIERIPFSGGHPTPLIAHGNYPSWNL